MTDYEATIGAMRQKFIEHVRRLNDDVAGLLRQVDDMAAGCNEGLTAYGMCHRVRGHKGAHWREDCGMWRHEGSIHFEYPEVRTYALGESNVRPALKQEWTSTE